MNTDRATRGPLPPVRKGAARIADIPPDVRAQLNAGTLATANLVEGLAIDFAELLGAAVPDVPAESVRLVREAATQGVTRRMELVGALLLQHLGVDGLPRLSGHPSDTVRGWACFVVGLAPKLKLKARLELIRPFADDPHFGVREWAWMPIRTHLAANVGHAIKALVPWVGDESANVRRFASEATRPRGVWTSHIEQLKQSPELALPLLDPLHRDLSPYVQDSVANWLNDASKSQPEWVREVCRDWRLRGHHPATERICTRALRTIGAG